MTGDRKSERPPESAPTLCGPLVVESTGQLDAIYALRVTVWRATGQLALDAFPSGRWSDPTDAQAVHWCVTLDGVVVAAARWRVCETMDELCEPEQYAAVGLSVEGAVAEPGRVVVREDVQRYGVASMLLDAQDQYTAERGIRYALRQASPGMVRLLRRRGWKIVGPAPSDARFPGVEFQIAVRDFNHNE